MSDLHLEFHRDNGESFIKSIDPNQSDVLVLAGDICSKSMIKQSLQMISYHFYNQQIIYVSGNHEFYSSTKDEVLETIKETCKEYDNIKFLDNEIFEINGVRFIGSTLWFDHPGERIYTDKELNDFNCILDIYDWIKQAGNDSIKFLKENVKENDVIITHHLPHEKSISSTYKGSSLNRYFLHSFAYQIFDNKPKLWIHGHTHQSLDYIHDGCRVVCNPTGYLTENAKFDRKLIVEC